MLTAGTVSRWLPGQGQTAVCAVSGGLDSMCLLHLLFHWRRERGAGLLAAHFNHALRPDADRDEMFVRDWCREREIPFTAGRGDVRGLARERGLSLEEAAREARYAFLRGLTAGRQEIFLYTAHHAGDNAETVLLNLIRGTGVRGLSGMRHERDNIIRPLLDVTREELEEYAAAHGIPHVEDETNRDPDAAVRNRIRLEVLPLLRELNPRAETHIRAAAAAVGELDDFLEADARRRIEEMNRETGQAKISLSTLEAAPEPVRLSLSTLEAAPEPVRPRMLLLCLDALGVGRKDYGRTHLQALLNLCGVSGTRTPGNDGKRLDLPHGVTARVREGELVLERRFPPPGSVTLRSGVPVKWNGYTVLMDISGEMPHGQPYGQQNVGGALILSLPSEEMPVTVGPCPVRGRMTLPGMRGSRTVKRLCVDRGISLDERDGLPAFYVDGQTAAVWKLGTDAAFSPDRNGFRCTIQVIPPGGSRRGDT